MTYPSNSDDLPIRKLYDRWERFEDSRREMSDDLKELFAEGKASGHNPKAMRIAFAERYRQTHDDADKRAKRELQDEEVELYLAALAGVPARAREIIEEFPPVPSFVATSSGGSEYAYDAETGEVLDTSSTAARKDVQSGPDAHRHARLRPKSGPAGTQAPPVDTSSQGLTNLITPSAGTGGEEDRQPIQALEASETGEFEEYPSGGSGTAREASGGKRTEQSEMRGLEEGPEVAPPTNAREGAPADEAEPTQVEASSVTPKRKWPHSDPAHRDCLNPEQCGGFSNHGLCQRCKDAAA